MSLWPLLAAYIRAGTPPGLLLFGFSPLAREANTQPVLPCRQETQRGGELTKVFRISAMPCGHCQWETERLGNWRSDCLTAIASDHVYVHYAIATYLCAHLKRASAKCTEEKNPNTILYIVLLQTLLFSYNWGRQGLARAGRGQSMSSHHILSHNILLHCCIACKDTFHWNRKGRFLLYHQMLVKISNCESV